MSVNATCRHAAFVETAEPACSGAPMKQVCRPEVVAPQTQPAGHCEFVVQRFTQMNDAFEPRQMPDAQSEVMLHGAPRSGKSSSPHAAVMPQNVMPTELPF